jgi:DNA invertase Pin-like site-specific DNA recombinase
MTLPDFLTDCGSIPAIWAAWDRRLIVAAQRARSMPCPTHNEAARPPRFPDSAFVTIHRYRHVHAEPVQVNNDRPGLVRVLEAAQAGKIDAVLVWKLDRFGRSAFDLLGNIRQPEAAGVRFVAVTQGIDIPPRGDPMSRLLLTMLAAVAEFERDLIVERTRLGLANARRAGKQLGRPRVALPDSREVHRLKTRGATWPEIAGQLGCTVWAARVAAKKGLRNRRGPLDESAPPESAGERGPFLTAHTS